MNSTGRVYFKNLNAIRFFAALLVIIHHTEQIKVFYDLPSAWHTSRFVWLIGKLGVVLFFVLSGFLITYLLLLEKKITSTIDVKSFYKRRILRIWPLYFLIVMSSLFILPNIHFLDIPGFVSTTDNLYQKLFLFILFLPNLLLSIYGVIPFASQTWSIGVEEQFYLYWPLIFKSKRLNSFISLLSVIIIYLAIRFLLYNLPEFSLQKLIIDFWEMFNIDCMAIGGLYALIHFENKKKIIRFLFDRKTQWFTLIATLFLMFTGSFVIVGYQYEIYAILFGVIILNFATNPSVIFSLENRVTNFLGKISYGLYMYHSIAIVITIKVMTHYKFFNNILLYIVTLCITIFLASISYKFIEERFIKLKVKFSKVISGDNANKNQSNVSPNLKRKRLIRIKESARA